MDTVDLTKIEPEVDAIVRAAPQIAAIRTAEQADGVGIFLKKVAEVRKRIAEFFRPNIDAAHKLHRSLLAQMKQVDERPAELEAACRRMLALWTDEQERVRREEQERLDYEARQKAEDEARAAATNARLSGNRAAAKLHAQEAEAIASGNVAVVSTAVNPVRTTVLGVRTQDVYRAELVDLKALVQAVASGRAPITLVAFNQSEADRLARNTKGSLMVPGVRWVKETGIRRTR